MPGSFQPLAFSKTKKITKTIFCVLSRDFLMNWGMQASENLVGFESFQPNQVICMYNRYIPQQDGSYRRNRVPDNCRQPAPCPVSQKPAPSPPPPAPCPPPQAPVCPPPTPEPCCGNPLRHSRSGEGVGGFLRQLLPKDFDTGDLLIVLLLLLMAGDSPEDQNTALLTLAIYLFL